MAGTASRKIWGILPLQIKISTDDTDGALFVFEHADMAKGGSPRHFHKEQDEWFYAIKATSPLSLATRFTLRPGDSLFAPRMIPHAWTYAGDGPGTLLVAVRPAGSVARWSGDPRRRKRIECLPPMG
jgi:quercetin dioxygenase-like cupin family protein